MTFWINYGQCPRQYAVRFVMVGYYQIKAYRPCMVSGLYSSDSAINRDDNRRTACLKSIE
jgi:hypothetical protein